MRSRVPVRPLMRWPEPVRPGRPTGTFRNPRFPVSANSLSPSSKAACSVSASQRRSLRRPPSPRTNLAGPQPLSRLLRRHMLTGRRDTQILTTALGHSAFSVPPSPHLSATVRARRLIPWRQRGGAPDTWHIAGSGSGPALQALRSLWRREARWIAQSERSDDGRRSPGARRSPRLRARPRMSSSSWCSSCARARSGVGNAPLR